MSGIWKFEIIGMSRTDIAAVLFWFSQDFTSESSTKVDQNSKNSSNSFILFISVPRGHSVKFWSSIGIMHSRDTNLQVKVHQTSTLLRSIITSDGHFRPDALACVWMEVYGTKRQVWLWLQLSTAKIIIIFIKIWLLLYKRYFLVLLHKTYYG